MKNKIIYLFLTALLSFNLFSNENTLRPGSGVYEFHFFNVTNPAGFVAAIETFDSSSCAEKWRNESGANVGLYSRMGGRHSHIILVAYENYDMMQKGQNIYIRSIRYFKVCYICLCFCFLCSIFRNECSL